MYPDPYKDKANPTAWSRNGFTLAELLVATTILTIVMTAVYTAFNGTIRAWRVGEASIDTYQSARQILWLISRDLHSLAPGSEEYFRGERDQFTFFTVGQPMDVDNGQARRVLKVTYRRRGKGLIREESILKGPLYPLERGKKKIREPRLEFIKREGEDFLLSPDVRDFRIEYIWVPNPPRPRKRNPAPLNLPIPPIVTQNHRLAWGLPHNVRIEITLKDESAESGERTFSTQLAFNTARTPVPRHLLPKREEGRS